MNLAQAENQEGVMKKWLKRLNSTPFGFMPAGPRLLSYKAVCCGFFFLRRKAAKEKNGLGRIAGRILCSCKLRLRRASPTVGLHSGPRALLGLRRLHVGFMSVGSRLAATKCIGYFCGFDDRDGAATSFSCAKSVSTKLTTTMSASGLFSTRLLGFSALVTPLPFACNIQQSGNAPS